MTPRKAPLFGSFLFIDPARGFNLCPVKSTSQYKKCYLTD